jgi:hypothetical protein
MSLPPAAAPFCDAWKRAEELLQGAPHVPMVCLKPGAAGDAPPPPPADAKKGGRAATAAVGISVLSPHMHTCLLSTRTPPMHACDTTAGSKAVVTSRELDGQLFAGHECFEWLLAVISNVTAAEVGGLC